jgi:hypothetical protein
MPGTGGVIGVIAPGVKGVYGVGATEGALGMASWDIEYTMILASEAEFIVSLVIVVLKIH